MSKDHETFFGIFSYNQKAKLINLLAPLKVRFRFLPEITTEEMLKEWCALDESSEKSKEVYNLLINTEDLELVGTKIVELYPERKFGA